MEHLEYVRGRNSWWSPHGSRSVNTLKPAFLVLGASG